MNVKMETLRTTWKSRLRSLFGFVRSIWPYLVIVSAGVICAALWTQGKVIYYWDEYLPLNPSIDARVFAVPWLTVSGHGQYWPEAIYWWWQTAPYLLLSEIHLDLQLSQIVYFTALLVIAGIGLYKLTPLIFGWEPTNPTTFVPRLAGAILYMNNYWVMSAPLNDNYVVWFAYALLPWCVLVLLRIKPGSFRFRTHLGPIVVLVLLSLMIGGFAVLYPPVALEIVLIAVAYYVLANLGNRKELLTGLSKIAAVIVLANLWQALLIFQESSSGLALWSSSTGYQSALVILRSSSDLLPQVTAIRFPAPPFGQPVWGATGWTGSVLTLLGFAIPLLALFPLLTASGRRSKPYVFSVTLYLGSLVLLEGLSGPAAGLYEVLFVPGSPALGFHDLYTSWGFAVCFFVSTCVSFGVCVLLRWANNWKPNRRLIDAKLAARRRSRVALTVVLSVAAIGVIVGSQFVAWTPNAVPSIAGVSSRTTFPSYFWQLSDYLEQNDQNRLVLGLPVGATLMGLNWSDNQSGFIGTNPFGWSAGIPGLFDGEVSPQDYSIYYSTIYDTITYSETTQFAKLLVALDIEYVVLQTNFIQTWPGGPPPFSISHLEAFLSSQSNLTLAATFGPFLVYSNTLPVSLFVAGHSINFAPTLSNPWNVSETPTGYFETFTDVADQGMLPNGTVGYLGHAKVSNSSFNMSLTYAKSLQTNYTYMLMPSYTSLGFNSTSVRFIIVNFTCSSPAAQLYLEAGNVTYGTPGSRWVFLNYFDASNPGDLAITAVSSITPTSVAFELPYYAPSSLNFVGFGITLFSPHNDSNYWINITSVKFAQYVSPAQWADLLIGSSVVGSEHIFISNGLTSEGAANGPLPRISYAEINSVDYSVNVVGAESPFVLLFAQTYSGMWTATFRSDGTVVGPHFQLNEYANGWLVSQLGNYTILVQFIESGISQITLYATISGIGAVFLGVFFCWYRWRRR